MKKGWQVPVVAILIVVVLSAALYRFLQQRQPDTVASHPVSPGQPGGEPPKEAGPGRERLPVKVLPARKSSLELTLPVFGAVTYVDKCDASYEEPGSLIKDVPVQVGEMVKPGKPVAIIDTEVLQDELRAKRANLDQVKALLDLAYWKYEAQRQVQAKGGSSLQELEEALATYHARRAEVAQIQAEISRLETRLNKAVIRSPIFGVVGKKNYYPGEKVPLSTDKGIVTIYRLDEVYVEAEISEKDLTKLCPGLEAAIYPDAFPRHRFVGVLEQLEPVLKEQSRTVIARIRVNNENFLLKPGMFTRLEIILEKTPPVVNVPLEAVRTAADKSAEVFVIVDDVAFKKKVEVGLTTAGAVQIKSGLEPGDVVVVEGGDQLKELSRVIAIPVQPLPNAP